MRYLRRASPLHAARAAAGGLWCVALAVAALGAQHPVVLAWIFAATLAGAVAAGVGREVARVVMWTLPLAAFFALINPFVARDGLTVFYRLGEIPPFGQVDLTLEALAYGGLYGMRIVVAVTAFGLMSLAVDPDGILRLFGRLSFRTALGATMATRMVPVLARDARRLADAQRCRPEGSVNRIGVLRAVTGGALDRSLDVAATLEVRGFAGAARARALRDPWSRHDIAFTAAAVAVLAGVIAARVAGVAVWEIYPTFRGGAAGEAMAAGAALAAVALLPFLQRKGIEP